MEEIARSTKIGLRFLHAIEAENFGKLPGGVYSTSYIRQYAQAIGYDESVVLDHYYCQMGLEPTTETAPSQGRFARRRLRGDDALRSFFEHVAAGRRNQHSAQSHAPA